MNGEVWMVKVEGYKEWPFMVFPTEEAALECALSIHPGRDDVGDIVRRAPLCDKFFMVGGCGR